MRLRRARRPGAPIAAAAGAVALSSPRYASPPGFGFGPPLAPFEIPPELAGWWDRSAAMSLPTISRCRDLICSAVSALPFTLWSVDTASIPSVERQIPPAGWMTRPDPNYTRQWIIAWTVDDLMFYERSHWLVTSRYVTSFPASFARIPPGALHVATDGTVSIDGSPRLDDVDPADVVEFCSPIEGLLSNGYRAISIALQLDSAADRFASTEVPAGVLEEQDGGEDLSSTELAELADAFSAARHANMTAATNKYVRYREIPYDASALQLVEGRTYQALELARLGNVPPYLVGAPAGTGMTYLNGRQAKEDLIDFGAAPYLGCIEQTLSGPNVTPRGQAVRLDQNAWLRNPFTTAATPSPNDLQIADPAQPTPSPDPSSPTPTPSPNGEPQ
jgi:Phage portal protein